MALGWVSKGRWILGRTDKGDREKGEKIREGRGEESGNLRKKVPGVSGILGTIVGFFFTPFPFIL